MSSPRVPRSGRSRAAAILCTAALAVTGATAVSGASAADPSAPGDRGFTVADSQPVRTGTVSADKAPSSSLARTPHALTRLTSGKQIPVMIKYDYDAIASYTGSVRGLAPTSPSVTKRSMSVRTSAVRSYRHYVAARERAISRRLETAVPSAVVGRSFRMVYGGVAAIVPGNRVRALLRVPGVVAVQRDAVRQPLTDSSTDFINAPTVYAQLPGGRRDAGKGVILGNLDTGVWPEHPSFADKGNLPAPPGPARACDFGDNPLTPAVDPFPCNHKLIGGAAFTDTYESLNSDLAYPGTARDSEGHGSHTASTSAGDVVTNVKTLGPTIARINGVAPGAYVMEYRVCGLGGCYTSDSTAAVGQAITDGVKVINFSISGGESPMTDPVELAFLDAYNAGVFVAASAGNSGPGSATTAHLSPWVTTVAASTQTRSFTSQLTLTAGDGAVFQTKGASLTAGVGPLPLVVASDAPYSDPFCLTPAPPGTFSGTIVVCERGGGGLGRVSKGYNVLQGGASGMVLYNPTLADVETDNHWLPAVHVADGTAMNAFIASHTAITAGFTAGQADSGRGDVMAAFSSRGPGGPFIKPDITAPGVQILAAMTPTPQDLVNGPPGQYYQAIAGTSMSSPHIAGAAILIKAVHPSWSPGQIKSAMMTQSVTSVVKEDETTPADAFDMGAGRIDVGRAATAPLTISDTGANMAAYTADPLHAIDLNIPSINAPTMPGSIGTVRTVTNVTNRSLAIRAAAVLPARTSMTFSPSTFTLAPGASRRITMTLTSDAPTGEQQFGTVWLRTPGRGALHLPLAFVHQQGSVTATQACTPASVALTQLSTCTVSATNEDFSDQDVSFTTSANDRLRITQTSAGTLSQGRVTGGATLAGAKLGVPSMDPALDTPGGGYLPLDVFGIPPEAIGDEEILNYDVPAFTYNGKVATSFGVDSNGYLIVGGGTSEDNSCCDLPTGPSSTRPNNILAPFWTDLDGTGAPGISVGLLSDGVDSWVVAQWEVNVFGTADTRAFQVWIGLNGTQDISYEYAAAQADPLGQDFLVGAENEAGAGDVTATLPDGSSQRVTSTDATPGDTFTYAVTVRGTQVGAGNVHTALTADLVRGTTLLDSPVQVRRR